MDAHIKIEGDKVIHNAPHRLVHLEDDFLKEWHKRFTGMDATAKQLLAWVAARV